jgi:hypothetical protein
LNADIDGLDKLWWNCPISNLVYELIAASDLSGLEPDLHVGVLSAAAGLPYVLAFAFRTLANGLQVDDLELPNIERDFVFTHDAVADDFEMERANPADDDLPVRVS